MEGFPEYNFPDGRISSVQFFLMGGLHEYNVPGGRIEKLYSGNPSIRKIVLWKSFHQENCTLDILLSGKLYSGNPTTRNIVLM
jgi:hypothetical protein